jgi:type IV secretion system protein VirB9
VIHPAEYSYEHLKDPGEKMFRVLVILWCWFSITANAQTIIRTVGAPQNGRNSTELAESVAPIPLTASVIDGASVEFAETGMAPAIVGTNGMVMYAYGQSRPSIVCAPLHICTIALLEGEQITNESIGDSVRWLVQPTTAGNQPIIVIKPTVAGIATNLVVTTDAGRIYYLTLIAKKTDYVPLVGFYDPQKIIVNIQHQNQVALAALEARRKAVVSDLGNVDPATLDFNYSCSGNNDSIKPVRVFAAGGHTYLQMPPDMKYGDAPAVFNTSGKSTELMNSRLVHNYYVIDGIPAKFKLVLGVGNDAMSEECTHGKHGWFN